MNSDPNPQPLLFTTCCLLWSCAGHGAVAPGFIPESELRTQMALWGGQGGCGEGAEWGGAEWAGWEWGGGGVGRGRSGEREGGVAQGLLVGCCLQGEDPLPPLRGVCIPTTACVDIPCLIKIYRLLCYFKVK